MADFRTDKEILDQFLGSIRLDIIASSDQQGRNATGNAKAGLTVETGFTSGKLIDKAGYTEWGWEYGRAPGRFPPIEAISRWIDAKGIIPQDISKKSLAFLIARKIAREGTKLFRQGEPSGVITDNITEDRMASLQQVFADKYSSMIMSEMIRGFTTIQS